MKDTFNVNDIFYLDILCSKVMLLEVRWKRSSEKVTFLNAECTFDLGLSISLGEGSSTQTTTSLQAFVLKQVLLHEFINFLLALLKVGKMSKSPSV